MVSLRPRTPANACNSLDLPSRALIKFCYSRVQDLGTSLWRRPAHAGGSSADGSGFSPARPRRSPTSYAIRKWASWQSDFRAVGARGPAPSFAVSPGTVTPALGWCSRLHLGTTLWPSVPKSVNAAGPAPPIAPKRAWMAQNPNLYLPGNPPPGLPRIGQSDQVSADVCTAVADPARPIGSSAWIIRERSRLVRDASRDTPLVPSWCVAQFRQV